MTQRYTPVWDDREPVEILTKRVGYPAEVVGEFLLHPDDPHPGRSFVTVYPADSKEGQRQIDAMAEALFRDEHRRYEPLDDWRGTTDRARDMWRRKARAALDALRSEG